MKLVQIREQINEVDRQLVELYCKRMELTRQVAMYKYEADMKIRDKKRDEEIYAQACASCSSDLAPYVHRLYETILENSTMFQRRVMIQSDVDENIHDEDTTSI